MFFRSQPNDEKTNSGFIIEDPSDIHAVIDASKRYITEHDLLMIHGSKLRAAVKKHSAPEFAKNSIRISQKFSRFFK